ncbi:Putative pentatricopeptide repeat-containing protein [Striga hermonthica]|uniref:Pentatricopeptide repeat-containing protein n=1 Tax=Striga hermonthica TaxID=68872 RepID=A0A9N7MU73_STRHE|nr:Putative pentatricopeptide repeat-containing protein [Striga hermonthica]
MVTAQQLSKLLEACKTWRCLDQLHPFAIKTGLTHDAPFAAQLIVVYSRFTTPRTTRNLLDEIPERTVRIFNTILKCYYRHGQHKDCLLLFPSLVSSQKPDLYSICTSLKACAALGEFDYGKMIHGLVRKTHGVSGHAFLGSALVEIYSKFGKMDDALCVFDEFPKPDTVLWSTVVTGYLKNGGPNQALEFFARMVRAEGIVLDSIALVSVVSACAQTSELKAGRSVHSYMIRTGLSENGLSLLNALLNLYGKMGSVNYAASLFNKMPQKDFISWGCMISCYAHNGCSKEALYLFDVMLEREIKVNTAVVISALHACEASHDLNMGRRIHKLVVSKKIDLDILVSTALIDMYMSCCSPDEAIQVFDRIPVKDRVSFSAVLSGCVENGRARKAVGILRDMLASGFRPDFCDSVKILKACSELGVFHQTSCVHGLVIRDGLFGNSFVHASLIESYAKCGSLEGSIAIFEQMLDRDTVIWSSMFSAYGLHGKGHEALMLFRQMTKNSSISPNELTFLSILSACSHTGLLEEGVDIFNTMVGKYGIKPNLKHYGILVDLLGRMGELDKAMRFIGQIKETVGADVWGALLNSCRIYGNSEIGKIAAEKVFDLNTCDAGHYILLSNIYAYEENWYEVARVRNLVREKELKRLSGQSFIETRHEICAVTNDRSR